MIVCLYRYVQLLFIGKKNNTTTVNQPLILVANSSYLGYSLSKLNVALPTTHDHVLCLSYNRSSLSAGSSFVDKAVPLGSSRHGFNLNLNEFHLNLNIFKPKPYMCVNGLDLDPIYEAQYTDIFIPWLFLVDLAQVPID